MCGTPSDAMQIAVQVDGRPSMLLLRFAGYYMTSGWRFTSTINYLVETIVTHTCLARNAKAFYELRGRSEDGSVKMEDFKVISWEGQEFQIWPPGPKVMACLACSVLT